jgi:hypothetical protein
MKILWKDDRSCENGTGQGPSSSFIAAGLDKVLIMEIQQIDNFPHIAKLLNY